MPDPYESQRNDMIAFQIEARGVRDARVLEAMREIRRHEFVSPDQAPFAYDDRPLPIGHGQTISQPYIVARMSELLEVAPGQTVLEIGAGCGYQTAILCRLARHVFAIEIIPQLAALALANLQRAGLSNCTLIAGDGTRGWTEHAPFERILVAACSPSIPAELLAELACGGRMIIPVGPRHCQDLTLARKDASGKVEFENHGAVSFVPLVTLPRRQSSA